MASTSEQIRDDYVADLVETSGLDTDQIIVDSVDVTDGNTYTLTSTIRFSQQDTDAAETLRAQIENATAFTRLKTRGSVSSAPVRSQKTFGANEDKPRVYTTKKNASGSVTERLEVLRFVTGRRLERLRNPVDESDVLETTDVGVADSSGNYVRATLRKNGSRTLVKKRQSDDAVVETTEVSAPDASNRSLWATTYADGSVDYVRAEYSESLATASGVSASIEITELTFSSLTGLSVSATIQADAFNTTSYYVIGAVQPFASESEILTAIDSAQELGTVTAGSSYTCTHTLSTILDNTVTPSNPDYNSLLADQATVYVYAVPNGVDSAYVMQFRTVVFSGPKRYLNVQSAYLSRFDNTLRVTITVFAAGDTVSEVYPPVAFTSGTASLTDDEAVRAFMEANVVPDTDTEYPANTESVVDNFAPITAAYDDLQQDAPTASLSTTTTRVRAMVKTDLGFTMVSPVTNVGFESALNATLGSAEFASSSDKTLRISGTVVADETRATTYHAFATTHDPKLDPIPARDLALSTDPETAIAVTGNAGKLTDVTLPYVLDVTGKRYPSSAVNAATAYVYATDGVASHDALTTREVPASDNLPHLYIHNFYWSRFYDKPAVDVTAFSSWADIASVYTPAVFTSDVDLTDQAAVLAFVTSHSTLLESSGGEVRAVLALELYQITEAYTALTGDPQPPTETLVVDGTYKVVVAAVDVLGNTGLVTLDPSTSEEPVGAIHWKGARDNQPNADLSLVGFDTNGRYGWCSGLSGDGNTALIAGYDYTGGGLHVWTRNTTTNTWSMSADLSLTLTTQGSYAFAAAISVDGTMVVVNGAYTSSPQVKYVYVWLKNQDGTWGVPNDSQTSGRIYNTFFGRSGSNYAGGAQSLAVSHDKRVIVDAGYIDNTSGMIYVWERGDDNTSWGVSSETAFGGYAPNHSIRLENIHGWGGYQNSCLAISHDATLICVGCHGGSSNLGGAFIWEKGADGTYGVPDANNSTGIGPNYDLSILSGADGQYGTSVAMSSDGETVLVTSRSGWIWKRTPDGTAYGVADSNSATGYSPNFRIQKPYDVSGFTSDIAMTHDGKSVLFSAGLSNDSGVGYLYSENSDETWSLRGGFSMIGGANGYYGKSNAISADGSVVLLAGYASDSISGGAWIWDADRGPIPGLSVSVRDVDWSQEVSNTPDAELARLDGTALGQYGSWSALSGDGKTAVIAAFRGTNGGGLFVWTRGDDGVWTMTDDLSYLGGWNNKGSYGIACGVSWDGELIAVSGTYVNSQSKWLFIWEKSPDGIWGFADTTQPGGVIQPSRRVPRFRHRNNSNGAYVGGSVSLAVSANKRIIADGGNAGSYRGFVYLWEKIGGVWGTSNPALYMGFEPSYSLSQLYFTNGYYGDSVALSGDGSVVCVGARGTSNTQGGAWVWVRNADGTYGVPDTSSVYLGFAPNHNLSKLADTDGVYGYSVDISFDAQVILVTAMGTSTGGGAGWIWKRNAEGTAYGVEDAGSTTGFSPNVKMTRPSGAIGEFGKFGHLSADGKLALITGPNDFDSGGAFLFVENDTDGTWSVLKDLSKTSGANGRYAHSSALSGDGTTALLAGYQSDETSGSAWIWQGIDQGERTVLSNPDLDADPSDASEENTEPTVTVTGVLDIPSDLNVTLTSVSFSSTGDGTLTVSGEVTADASRETSYRVYATTDPAWTTTQVRDDVPVDSEALTLGSAGVLSEVSVSSVVDVRGNVYPSAAVNQARVFLMGTDGVRSHDAIATSDVSPDDDLPHVNMHQFYWSRLFRSASVDITAFSSVANLTSIYHPLVFASSVDLSDAAALGTFVTTHGAVLEGATSDVYEVWSRGLNRLTEAYTNLDVEGVPTTETIVENGTYVVVLVAVDASERTGLVAIGGSETLDAPSALDATLTSASFKEDNTALVVSGQVIPDATRPTVYRVFARTDPNFSEDQVRDFALSEANGEVVVTGVATGTSTEVEVPQIVDVLGNAYPVSTVNRASVYWLGTDDERSHDALATPVEVSPADDLPHVSMSRAFWSQFYDALGVDHTAFSSVSDVTLVYRPLVFDASVDLSDAAALTAFVTTRSAALESVSASVFEVMLRTGSDYVFEAYVSALTDDPAVSEPIVPNGAYTVVLAAEDALGNRSVRTFAVETTASSGGTISVRVVDWSAVVPNTPNGDLSKSSGLSGQYGWGCSLSKDGKTALISDKSSSNGGAYVWDRNDDGSWTEYGTKLTFTPVDGTGAMGDCCAISADGNTALVSGQQSSSSGNAAVWRRSTEGVWTFEQDLSKKSDTNGYYGLWCALSADGQTALISAPDGSLSSGGAWIWNRSEDGVWGAVDATSATGFSPSADLSKLSNTGGYYGRSCALSGDGSVALLAGYYAGTDRGNGWIWIRNQDGTWGVSGGPNHDLSILTGANGYYGNACSLSLDGGTALIVGSNTGSSGCAYVWTRDESTGTYTRTADLSKSGTNGRYGRACCMAADGKSLVVSGQVPIGTSGCMYLWTLQEDGVTWQETADLSKPSGAIGEYGISCAISGDGATAMSAGYGTSFNGPAFVWYGVDQGERYVLTYGTSSSATSSQGIQTLSDLNVSVTSVTTSGPTMTITGQVVPDTTLPTTYYAFVSTESDWTADQVRTTILDAIDETGNSTNAAVIPVIPSDNGTFTLESVTSVLDGAKIARSPNTINHANVYLYGTNGTRVQDALDRFEVRPTADQGVLPYAVVRDHVVQPDNITIVVSCSAFSAYASLVSVRVLVVSVELDIETDPAVTATLANTYGTDLGVVERYAVGLFDSVVFTDVVVSADGSTAAYTEGQDYRVVMVVTDADGGVSVSSASTELSAVLEKLAEPTYTDLRGAYSLFPLFLAYTGPQVRLRRSSDNAEQDFTFDIQGVSKAYEAWIGDDPTVFAFVVRWYDQSGNGRHATAVSINTTTWQNTVTLDYANKRLMFGEEAYFDLPDATVPINNDPYTFVVHHGYNTHTAGVMVGSGTNSDHQANVFRRDGTYGYHNYWWYNDLSGGDNFRPKGVIVARYDGTSRNVYFPADGNGTEVAATQPRASTAANNAIGNFVHTSEYWKGDMYTVLIYETALAYEDLTMVESRLTKFTNAISTTRGVLHDFSSTRGELNGGYSCRKLYSDYGGAHVRLFRTDARYHDFTFDENGFSALYEKWIGTRTATVRTWYDQSGNDNHTTYSYGTSQFDYANHRLQLANTAYFRLPDGTIPYNNSPYTFVCHHGESRNLTEGCIIASGYGSYDGYSNTLILLGGSQGYANYWWNNDIIGGTLRQNQVVVARYDGSTRNLYNPVDGNGTEVPVTTARRSTMVFNTIGRPIHGNTQQYFKGDLYTILIYKSALAYTDISGISDRVLAAKTPPPEVFGTGWSLLRSLTPGATAWYWGDNNLSGLRDGEFLFTSGDFTSKWLITDHEQVHGTNYSNALRQVTRSSLNPSVHSVRWYNRSEFVEDPLIALTDWGSVSEANNELMFIENGNAESTVVSSIHTSGMYVYTRLYPLENYRHVSYDLGYFTNGNTTVYDISGANRNLTVYGTPGTDSSTKSMVLDGIDDYMRISNIGNSAGAWSHSIAFWIYLDSQILNQSAGYQETVFVLGYQTAAMKAISWKYVVVDAVTVQVKYGFHEHDTFMEVGPEYFDRWQHVVLTYDAGKNVKSVYHNGAFSQTTLVTSSPTSVLNLDSNRPMEIGRDPGGMDYVTGKLRQFQVFNRTMTAAEVYAVSQEPVLGVNVAIPPPPPDVTFDFRTDTHDATRAYEFVKHSAQGTMTFATDGSGLVFDSGGQAEVDLGPDFFDPNGSFTLQFDYSTQMPSGDRLFVSTWSNESVGSTVYTPTGFYVKAFDNALELGVRKSNTETMLKLNVNLSIMSGFNFFNVNTFTFVFYNTTNHMPGDKINIKIYVNGSLRGSLDIADNVLTQEERDAGVFYGSESHKLYLNRWMHNKASNCTFDNVQILRRAVFAQDIPLAFPPPPDVTFDFATDTRDATGAYEFVKHSAQGTMTFATDGSGLVFDSGGQAEVDLGPEYFDPNGSFTLQFDYSTQMPSGDRLFVSTWSNESVGSTVYTPTGFYVKAFDNALEMGIQKSNTFGDTMLKLNVNMSIMSGFNFFNVNTFTFVFYNTKNHVSGDKINLKIYANGSLRGSLDIADNVLTQEERDAGVFYGSERHKLYLNRWMHNKASNCTFDNVRFLRNVVPGVAQIEVYAKVHSGTSGFVTSDPSANSLLLLSQLRLFTEKDWNGATLPYTINYVLPGDYYNPGTSSHQSLSTTNLAAVLQNGLTNYARWSTTYIGSTYVKVFTVIPTNAFVGSLQMYAARVKYSFDMKIVYKLHDGKEIALESPTLQLDSRFTGEEGAYPSTRTWDADLDFEDTTETYHDEPFNVSSS